VKEKNLIMPDYIEYNGEKIKPRVFDYDTPEG